MSTYKWVSIPAELAKNPRVTDCVRQEFLRRYPNWTGDRIPWSDRLCNVGINADGSLHNPNGYPEDVVRAAVLAADARSHERRSRAAKAAAKTRARRQEHKVYTVARRIVAGNGIGPRHRCFICGKHLEDPKSIARGIGSECWQGVLTQVSALRAAHPSASPTIPEIPAPAGRPAGVSGK